MEIARVVREIEGDNRAIKVKQKKSLARKNGDVVMSTEIRIRDNAEGKKENIYNETVVIEPIRRRLDEEINGENNGLSHIEDMEDHCVNGSKNLQLAGPGVQARPLS